MYHWLLGIWIAVWVCAPGVVEVVRRRERRRLFRASRMLLLGDRSVAMSDVKEIRAESFQDVAGVALIVVLRDDEEITVPDHSRELAAAFKELQVDPNRILRACKRKVDGCDVLWRA